MSVSMKDSRRRSSSSRRNANHVNTGSRGAAVPGKRNETNCNGLRNSRPSDGWGLSVCRLWNPGIVGKVVRTVGAISFFFVIFFFFGFFAFLLPAFFFSSASHHISQLGASPSSLPLCSAGRQNVPGFGVTDWKRRVPDDLSASWTTAVSRRMHMGYSKHQHAF